MQRHRPRQQRTAERERRDADEHEPHDAQGRRVRLLDAFARRRVERWQLADEVVDEVGAARDEGEDSRIEVDAQTIGEHGLTDRRAESETGRLEEALSCQLRIVAADAP